MKLVLDGKSLTIDDVYSVAHSTAETCEVSLHKEAEAALKKSNQYVDKIVKEEKITYGINTGFGALSSKYIPPEKLQELQYNLIRSHCTGVGETFSIPIVRAIMLLRANCLIQGFSGITPSIIDLLVDFINFGITPIIPKKGSVGASGDLAPLSHLALCLIGEGEVRFQNKTYPAKRAISLIKKNPITLGPKDGLALINGTTVMAALGCLSLVEANRMAVSADIIGAMTLEAVRGTIAAFDSRIHALKPLPGQVEVAKNMNMLLEGSEILTSHTDCNKVQDPYSLRCIPQVHGASRQTFKHAEEILSIEINSVTDNPLVFPDEEIVISGGNFHGQALSFCMDYMALGLAEIGSMSERRVEKMMNPEFSHLPAFLAKDSGLNSGMMIAHVTSAALVSENKILCHPASIDSIPTSTDKEDHVSMGVTAGRKLYEILENLSYILAIELHCNTQGYDLLRPLKSSPALESVYGLIRNHVDKVEKDRVFSHEIEKIAELVRRGEVINEVKDFVKLN